MDLISLLEQQLGQVGAVLARDTGDERHTAPSVRYRRAAAAAARCHAGDSAMLEHIFHDATVLCGRIGTAGIFWQGAIFSHTTCCLRGGSIHLCR